MKKLLTVLFALLMVFTLVGCSSKKEEEMAGGYVEAEKKELTPELIEMFEKAFEGYVGAEYVPLMLDSTQVVAGTNYKFLADGTKKTDPIVMGTYYVYINKNLQGEVSVLNIETIEEHEVKMFEPEEEIEIEIKKD